MMATMIPPTTMMEHCNTSVKNTAVKPPAYEKRDKHESNMSKYERGASQVRVKYD